MSPGADQVGSVNDAFSVCVRVCLCVSSYLCSWFQSFMKNICISGNVIKTRFSGLLLESQPLTRLLRLSVEHILL